MTTLSSEELQAQRSDFGLRLSNSMAKYGPLCVGIDPHRKLLTDWGYNVDAEGAELFSMRMGCRPPTGAPQQSNSRRRCSSATEPKVSKRSSACSTRHDKWASSPSSIACAAACPPRFPPSQTPISSPVAPLLGRRHHAAAVLWRAFVERPDYRSAGKRTPACSSPP